MENWIILIIILVLILKCIEYRFSLISDTAKSKNIMSNSEYRIAQYLDKLGVKYKTQYTFIGCRDINLLPFDFAIINKRGKVLMLIEYDGEQHSHPVMFKGVSKKEAQKNYEKCVKHDKIKNKYCKRKKIKLLRIDYTERNDLYKIIKRELIANKIINPK